MSRNQSMHNILTSFLSYLINIARISSELVIADGLLPSASFRLGLARFRSNTSHAFFCNMQRILLVISSEIRKLSIKALT